MNEIIKENVFSVYEKNINISLFNEIIAFIISFIKQFII